MAGLALAAILVGGDPAIAMEPRYGRVANTDGANLRMRAAPGANAAIVKRLALGTRLTVMGGPTADGRWLQIEHGGTTGYVAASYVELEEAGRPASSSST
jgi:uncharacterized protein YraI